MSPRDNAMAAARRSRHTDASPAVRRSLVLFYVRLASQCSRDRVRLKMGAP
jgi:hypothetical protein